MPSSCDVERPDTLEGTDRGIPSPGRWDQERRVYSDGEELVRAS